MYILYYELFMSYSQSVCVFNNRISPYSNGKQPRAMAIACIVLETPVVSLTDNLLGGIPMLGTEIYI